MKIEQEIPASEAPCSITLREAVTPYLEVGSTRSVVGIQTRQTTVEGLQPYYRGTVYREDLLWLLHDLDRIDKHRLLHTAVASSFGTLMEPGASQNVRCIGPGFIRVFGGAVETDTPIALIYGLHPIDPGAEMHVEIRPAFDLGLDPQTPVAPFATRMPLMRLLTDIYTHIGGTIIPALTPYL